MKQIDCRYCGEGRMVEKTYSRKIKSGRTTLPVEGFLIWHCEKCESEKIDARQFEHNADLTEAAQKQLPCFISIGTLHEFREQYLLSQRDASKLIGAGDSAFGKYESGKGISGPTAKLIRAALKFPEVAKMLADEEGIVIKSNLDVDYAAASSPTLTQALTDSGKWSRDQIPATFQLKPHSHRPSCVNDEAYLTNLGSINSRWERTKLVAAL